MPTGAAPVPRNSASANPKAINRMSWMPAWNAVGTSPSNRRVVSVSSSTDNCPAVANVSTSGRTAGRAAGTAAICRHSGACSTTSGRQACSASSDAHRENDVPPDGSSTC